MQNNQNNKCSIYGLLLISFIVSIQVLVFISPALAAENKCTGVGDFGELNFCPNVSVGPSFQQGVKQTVDRGTLGKYVSAWYGFIIGTVGILATIMIMYGGFKWMTSRGGSGINDAKDIIWSALIGLTLAFLSYTILYLINPDLLTIGLPEMGGIKYDINYVGDVAIPSNALGMYPQGGQTGGAPGRVGAAANVTDNGAAAAPGTRNGSGNVTGWKNGINDWDPKYQNTVNQMCTMNGVNSCGTYPGHSPDMQHAVDLMTQTSASTNPAQGDEIATYLMNHAQELNIDYVIWDHQIWLANQPPKPISSWDNIPNRGSPTANHEDHVHISFR